MKGIWRIYVFFCWKIQVVWYNKKVNRNKYYCTEFIYKILSDDKVQLFPKTKNVVKPMYCNKIKRIKTIYEGYTYNYDVNYNIIGEKIEI